MKQEIGRYCINISKDITAEDAPKTKTLKNRRHRRRGRQCQTSYSFAKTQTKLKSDFFLLSFEVNDLIGICVSLFYFIFFLVIELSFTRAPSSTDIAFWALVFSPIVTQMISNFNSASLFLSYTV